MVRLPLPPGRPRRRVPAAAPVAGLALMLACSLTACSGGDDEPDGGDPPPSSSSPTGAPPVETVATVGEVVGRLDKQRRAQLTTKVAAVVDAWIDAAYLGDFPRTDFSDAFPGFTKGAAADAVADAGLTSNKRYAANLEEVVATRRRVVVDALAVRRKAVAATAHVAVAMTLRGGTTLRERVSGRLFLTLADGAWRVFGYDLTRGRVR